MDNMLKSILYEQVFAGIDPTGELDDETIELMNTPRCGVKDNVGPGDDAKRKKRYALQGSRWKKDTLTWRISQYPSSSRWKKSQVDEEIKKAFDIWAQQIPVKFQKKTSGTFIDWSSTRF